ncbi:hypothetical protein ABEB36_010416 [Hypothenemus hampei]|uniref:Uncharacterized protein n=1 Tax=Hypothenemus hampei TaxID=57062 RepID=A0ABD1EK72_HYPHA
MELYVCFTSQDFYIDLLQTIFQMNEQQMKAAQKLIRNVCQPKTKATDDQIVAMHIGNFNQDQNGMCYLSCVLNYYKLQLPDNSFDWETGVKVVETQAPPSYAPFVVEALKQCKDAGIN